MELHTQLATNYLFLGYRILGVQMPERRKVLYVLYSVILNGLVTVYLPLSFGLSYLKMTSDELRLGSLLTSIQVAINDWGCAIKFIIMAGFLSKLHLAEPIFEKLDARCRADPEQRAQLQRMIRKGNQFVVFFAIAYWSYSSSTFLGSFIMGRPPYSLYNPFVNWRDSHSNFLLVAFTEYGLINVACFQQVVDDSYAVIYVSILRTHLQLLMQRISRLAKSDVNSEDNLEELKNCIIDYKNILAIHNIITPIISTTIFIQFMITATLLGITLINIFIFAADFSSKVACCFYIIAVVVEIFPLCYYAQCLIDDSNRMSDIIFHCNWFSQDKRFCSTLVYFLHRSQRSVNFSAGKLFPINLNSFLSIAKFSFTLYTFIKGMGIKEKYGTE